MGKSGCLILVLRKLLERLTVMAACLVEGALAVHLNHRRESFDCLRA